MKLLLYCTTAKPNLYMPFEHDCFSKDASKCYLALKPILEDIDLKLNGKIVAECECDLVERFDVPYPAYFHEIEDDLSHITEKSCLNLMELHHYLKIDTGYALHLSNLKTFDVPKKLKEYAQFSYIKLLGKRVDGCFSIKKAPQNMCYCFDKNGNKYILISIRSEYLCKILNGEKTIEVRRKILNELKELIPL